MPAPVPSLPSSSPCNEDLRVVVDVGASVSVRRACADDCGVPCADADAMDEDGAAGEAVDASVCVDEPGVPSAGLSASAIHGCSKAFSGVRRTCVHEYMEHGAWRHEHTQHT